MRPDTYKHDADGWDPYAESGSAQNNNNNSFTFKDNPLSIIALIFAALALGAIVMQQYKDPQIMDARIAEAAATVEAHTAQSIANADARAAAAKVDARVAIDKVDTLSNGLARKGININQDGH